MAKAQEPTQQSQYQEWIAIALEASRRGELVRARDAFQRAHELEPSARTLRGLGTVALQGGRHAEAYVAFSAALSHPTKPLPPDLAASVSVLVEQLRAKVALCELVGTPPDARVTVDDMAPVLDSDGRIVLSAGPHRLELTAPDHKPTVLEVEPAPGTVERFHIQLVATPRPTLPAPSEPTAPLSPTPRDVTKVTAPTRAAEPQAGRTWTWVATAGVPTFATAAALLWWKTVDTGEDLDAQCKRERCDEARRDALIAGSSLQTYETLTNVAWALAGVSLVAAGVALVLEGSASESSTTVHVTGTGVVLHGSF